MHMKQILYSCKSNCMVQTKLVVKSTSCNAVMLHEREANNDLFFAVLGVYTYVRIGALAFMCRYVCDVQYIMCASMCSM